MPCDSLANCFNVLAHARQLPTNHRRLPRTDSPPRSPRPSAMPVARKQCSRLIALGFHVHSLNSVVAALADRQTPRYTATASAYAAAPTRHRRGACRLGQAGGQRVALYPVARLLHQVGKGRQRHELTGGEEVAARRQPIDRRRKSRGFSGILSSGFHVWLRLLSDCFHLRCRRKIHAPTLALGNDGHSRAPMRPALPSALM